MTALSADRNTPKTTDLVKVGPLLASVVIFGGAIVMRNAAGYLTKGQTATGLFGVGVSRERKTGGASNGAETLRYEPGIWRFANSSSTDAITIAEVGDVCFVVDDQTVAKTDGSGTRSAAGFIEAVDSQGVWVRFDEAMLVAYLAGIANPA